MQRAAAVRPARQRRQQQPFPQFQPTQNIQLISSVSSEMRTPVKATEAAIGKQEAVQQPNTGVPPVQQSPEVNVSMVGSPAKEKPGVAFHSDL